MTGKLVDYLQNRQGRRVEFLVGGLKVRGVLDVFDPQALSGLGMVVIANGRMFSTANGFEGASGRGTFSLAELRRDHCFTSRGARRKK